MIENERIKEIRKSLKMTMERFGERLGVTKTAISNIEKSNRNVTEQMRKAICREFNVNEEWLRSGNGEMFVQLSQDDETAHIVQDMLGSNTGSFYNIILEIAKSYKKLKMCIRDRVPEGTLMDNPHVFHLRYTNCIFCWSVYSCMKNMDNLCNSQEGL